MPLIPVLHDRVRLTLGHRTGLGKMSYECIGPGTGWVSRTPYQTWSASVARPASGKEIVEVPCRICGQNIRLRVKSMAVERRNRIWQMIAGIWFAVYIVGIGFIMMAREGEDHKVEIVGPEGHAIIFPKAGTQAKSASA